MARLQQLNPGNYRSNDRIGAEFENVIRYLNAAELGNKTIRELLEQLFDEDGEWDGPIEFRYDGALGLQYRVGTFADVATGWVTLATPAALRGPAGRDLGTIEGPLFFGRQEFTATGGQTVISSNPFDTTTDDPIVWKNGALQRPTADYAINDVANTITFTSPLALNDKVTVAFVRKNAVANYRRSDQVSAGQAVFPFVHSAEERLLVFRNGILQREGGGADYTASPGSDTITFTTTIPSNDIITIMTVENAGEVAVGGLMLEDVYAPTGLIPYAKLLIADGDIPQAKIAGLVALLANRGRTFVSATTPVGAVAGDYWVDQSQAPNVLKFYDGVGWISTSPETEIPAFGPTDANRYLAINGTGTGLLFRTLDLSSRVPMTYIGAAGGVAELDSAGRVPLDQLPSIFSSETYDRQITGAVSNANFRLRRVFKQKIQIDGISTKLTSGSCTVQVTVDGALVGTTFSVTPSVSDVTIGTPIQVDATTSSKLIGFTVSGGSSPVDLEVAMATSAIAI